MISGPTSYQVGASNVTSVVTGDFNEDGSIDSAVTEVAGSVAIMLNDGAGAFATSAHIITGAGPQGMVVADFNGDHHLDIAVANSGASTLSILLGDGLGGFTVSPVSLTLSPFNLDSADFNHDTFADLVVGSNAGSNIAVLLGTGTGAFGSPTTITVGLQPANVFAKDYDHNGTIDIAAPDLGTSTIKILNGDGAGAFASPVTVASFTGGTLLQRIRDLGDLNGDGRPDLGAVAGPSGQLGSLWLVLNGVSGFSAPTRDRQSGRGWRTAPADFDGDGKIDLAVTNQSIGSVDFYAGNGSGGFTFYATLLVGTSMNALRAADLNGDNRPDVIGTRPNAGAIYTILIACGSGALADLEIANTGPPTAAVGATVTYHIAVTNHGPDPALGVVVTDIVPFGMTVINAAACTNAGGTLSCPIGSIAVNNTAGFDIQLQAFAPGTYVNEAMVLGQQGDPVPGNNGSFAATAITGAPLTFVVTNVQRQRRRIATPGDHRFERQPRIDQHDRLQHFAQWSAVHCVAHGAARDHDAGHDRWTHAARLGERAHRRTQRQCDGQRRRLDD